MYTECFILIGTLVEVCYWYLNLAFLCTPWPYWKSIHEIYGWCSSGTINNCLQLQLVNTLLKVLFTFLTSFTVSFDKHYNNFGKTLNTSYFLRWLTTTEVENEILERIYHYRNRKQDGSHQSLLFPRLCAQDWAENKVYTKESLYELMTGLSKPEQHKGFHKDSRNMGVFLRASEPGRIPVPKDSKIEDFFPTSAPLLDFLKLDSERPDSWDLPSVEYLEYLQSFRGINMDQLGAVEVREIVVGRSSVEEIKSSVDWFWTHYHDDQEKFPTGCLSMDVEEFKITKYDYLRLTGDLDSHLNVVVCSYKQERMHPSLTVEDGWFQFPTRIMLGNGLSWSLQILYPVDEHTVVVKGRTSSGLKKLEKLKIQPDILDLLRSLPVLVGVGIRGDVTEIEDVYSRLSGEEVTLSSYVELGTLALCLGWGSDRTNMPILAASTLGMIMNKTCSEGDKDWGSSWESLPDSLKSYCLADIRMGHLTYLVLISLLQRDLFPDRDTVCLLGNVDSRTFTEWFAAHIRTALLGTEVCPTALEQARSREELLETIRFRTHAGKISSRCPLRVAAIIPLLRSWPSITYGGPRNLHEARLAIYDSFLYLRKHESSRDEPFFQVVWDSGISDMVRFGMELESVDWQAPATTPGFGLSFSSEIGQECLVLDPATMAVNATQLEANRLGRPQKLLLLEWVRLNPLLYADLISRMERDKEVMRRLGSYYESLRLAYYRVTGSLDILSEYKEQKILEQNQRLMSRLKREVEEAENELEMRKTRLAGAEAEEALGLFTIRTGWEHVIPPTPKRPVKYLPRSRPRFVFTEPKRYGPMSYEQAGPSSFRPRSISAVTRIGRKRSRDQSCAGNPKRRRSRTPFTTSRISSNPQLILDGEEHPSCGKYVGKGKGAGKGASCAKSQPVNLYPTQDAFEERSKDYSYEVIMEYDDSILDVTDSD